MDSLSADQDLKLILLGGFDVRLNNMPVAGVSYNKMRALLAYLAVEREQTHNREALAELLWGGNDPVAARGNLRRAFSDLRKALELPTGKILFSASKHTIRFIPDFYIDALALTTAASSCTSLPNTADCSPCLAQMHSQTALYRGEFMAGFSLPDCPNFEDWLMMQRETLHRRALALLEQFSNCREQIGDYGKALQFALRYTELEPWDENAHCRVMRLYALNGQNSAAISQYEACCRLLKKDLNALPCDEIRHLAERIRKGEIERKSHHVTDITPPKTIPQLPAQRRQVTVLYCELILAEIDDPDEAMTLLRAPQARCAEIIRQFAGHIVQTHGSGLLAYFGYPQASEFAARHAVQSALMIVREAAHGIEIRAGIHTGLVITGDNSSMPDTVGKTSRLAIQLRQSAAPNEVAISRQTHDLAGWYFDCTSLGSQPFSGIAQPVEIFSVSGESGARTRLDTASQLTPLIGRQDEITKLTELWQKAVQGKHQVVLVQGEAGIGKTRLLHALKERLAGQPHAIRELRCFPEFSQSPFYPLIATLEGIFGFEHGDTPELKSGKLVQYLEARYPLSTRDSVPLLTRLLSLPLSGNYPSAGLTPQKQKEQTIAILLDLLHALAWQQPVLFIVEDLHWIDPSTLEFLTLLVEQEERGPLLAVFTTRPEFVPPWKNALKSALALAPLGEDDAAKMIVSINDGIPAATLRGIVERADGVPLFIEEMAKIAPLSNQVNVPATLQDLLTARIDHLGKAKYTAQIAATIGREFDLGLLHKVSPDNPAELTRDLDVLQDAGLILAVDERTRQFKHALIQEAAYQSQTKTGRQTVHGRIAMELQNSFPDVATAQPELLAWHFTEAGETRQSVEYWHKAGQLAAGSSANLEAMKHFNSALQLLITLPTDMDRNRTELTVLVSFCPVLYAVKGYGSEEATRANTRISELSGLLKDNPELFMAKWALVMNTIASAGSRGVPEAAMRLLDMAHDEPLRKQAAHYALANASFWLGDFETSRIQTEHAIVLYHPDQHRILLERYNEDLSISCAAYLSWSLYFIGYPDRAQQVCEQMLKQARRMKHPHTLGLALCFASVMNRWLNRREKTLSLSAETITLSRQHDFSVWLAGGEMTHGWALAMYGKEEGITELQSGIAGMRSAISGLSVIFLSALAEAYVHLAMHDKALALISETLADAVSTGDGHFTAELHRLKGVSLQALSPSNSKEAEACFDRAIAISRKQHAKSLELRAATSMAQLWIQQGRSVEAQRLLKKIYHWFTEGNDTHDLQKARELLESLG
ncbi:MAG: AAA family ATPase [Gallionella sp.]|nr:AAA family ATPase [Gallionella sp.]